MRVRETPSRAPFILLALGLLALAAALATSSSVAASSSGVKIKGQPLITAQEIKQAQDVNGVDYTVRPEPGGKGKTKAFSGTSIASLVGLRGLQEGDFGYLTFPGPGGTTIYLSSDDIFNSPDSFPEGPALVSVKSGTVDFLRPVRGSGKQNASDEFTSKAGQALVAESRDGNVLGVAVTSSDQKPDQGDTVDLSAKASGKTLPNENVRFAWQFSDGGKASGEKVSHTVSDSGGVVATATAIGTRGSGGQGSTTLEVGKVKPGANNGTGGNSNQPGGSGGTDGSGGVGLPPTSGGTTPPPIDYGSFPNYGSYPGYTPSPGSPPSGPAPSQGNTPPAGGPQVPNQDALPGANVETVSGTLVTNLSGAAGAPSRSDSAPASSEASPASIVEFNRNDSSSSLTLPLTGAGVALLFAAGAGRELQRSRRSPV